MATPSFARPQPTVLVVEDDPESGAGVVDAIGALGYRALWARDGGQALAALETMQPSLMLVDLFMPGMNGSQFLAAVRRSPQWSRIPRVIMTGANDALIGVKEDTAVLYKPFDLDALTEVIRRHCAASHAPRPAEPARPRDEAPPSGSPPRR